MSEEPFGPAFRRLLAEILERAPRLRGAPDRDPRARRRVMAQSGVFAGHRVYGPGEDLRFLDWNVYARTGELFAKVLEEEERRTLAVCVDCTPSMATGEPDRFVGALRLAAILGGLALVGLDGVHLVGGDERLHSLQGAAAVPRMLDTLARFRPCATDPVRAVRAPLEHGTFGRLCWISDFAEPERCVPALTLLRRAGRRCVGWLPMLPTDRAPQARGWVRWVDPETGDEEVILVDRALREAMADELRLLAHRQDAVFRAAGLPLVRFPLPSADDFRLTSWYESAWIYRF